jgi:rhodanese-related sulfurtransferase
MVDMGDDAEISDVRDGHEQSVNINEGVKRVNQDAGFVKKRAIKPLRKRQARTIFM